jgi:hypothetical protein
MLRVWRYAMATGNDLFSTIWGMAHLGNPKALLGKGGHGMFGEFRDFAMGGSMLASPEMTRLPVER